MCCGETFWKRVVVFCLTFGLGVLVSGLFISNKKCTAGQLPPSVKPIVISAPPENKNCVPLDENLKYERLTAKEKTVPAVAEEDSKLKAKKPEDKKKSLKAEKRKQNNSAEPKPHFYNPSKDSVEYKNLLHREKCFEAQDQK